MNHGFKVNDILVAKFGYNCTLVRFYKVLKVTETQIQFVEIDSQMVDHDGYGQAGHVMPLEIDIVGKKIIRRKVYVNGDYVSVKVDDYIWAKKWDGNKVHFDSYD